MPVEKARRSPRNAMCRGRNPSCAMTEASRGKVGEAACCVAMSRMSMVVDLHDVVGGRLAEGGLRYLGDDGRLLYRA